CGSASTSSVFRSAMASEAARFTAVVVLPTPPFWLAIAMILAMDPDEKREARSEKREARSEKREARSKAAMYDGTDRRDSPVSRATPRHRGSRPKGLVSRETGHTKRCVWP